FAPGEPLAEIVRNENDALRRLRLLVIEEAFEFVDSVVRPSPPNEFKNDGFQAARGRDVAQIDVEAITDGAFEGVSFGIAPAQRLAELFEFPSVHWLRPPLAFRVSRFGSTQRNSPRGGRIPAEYRAVLHEVELFEELGNL